jgi:DNA-binding transcriptional MerR regulator
MVRDTSVGGETVSTGEAARQAGITRATLQDWITRGKVKAPRLVKVGNVSVRLWTRSDVTRLKTTKKAIYQEKHPQK